MTVCGFCRFFFFCFSIFSSTNLTSDHFVFLWNKMLGSNTKQGRKLERNEGMEWGYLR